MRRHLIIPALLSLLFICSPLLAAGPLEAIIDCTSWAVEDIGPARCEIVDEGCRIHITGKHYLLRSAVKLPRAARYKQDWEIGLETRIDQGAAGVALGNDYSGLIFQVRESGLAEILAYRQGRMPEVKKSAKIKHRSPEYSLDVFVSVKDKRCAFSVNGEEVFDLDTGSGSAGGLHIPSSIRQVAVTTNLPEGEGREALVLHKRVHIHAD